MADNNMEIIDENDILGLESDIDDYKNYTDIFNALIRHPQITPEDFRVYVVIKSYTWGNGKWNLKISDLIEQTGVKRTTLFACLKWLEANGFLKRVERRNSKKERLPNTFIVKKLNPDTGLPVGITSIEKRKPAPKKKKEDSSNCGQGCGEPVDKGVDNTEQNDNSDKNSSAGEPPVVQQMNLGSSAGELRVVQQMNRLNTIDSLNTIVFKDYIEKEGDIFDPVILIAIWGEILEGLKLVLSDVTVGTWFTAFNPMCIEKSTLYLITEESIHKQYADVVFKNQLLLVLSKVGINNYEIVLKEKEE